MLLQVGEAGIQLSDLRTDDTASYTVSVRLSDAVATQTVELQVAGKILPSLSVRFDPVFAHGVILIFLTPSQCNSQSVLFSCSLPPARSDFISPAGVSFRPGGLSWGPLPGYKRVSKWRLQLQDSTPFPLLL